MRRDFHGRPKRLWLKYQQLLPEITEATQEMLIPNCWATIGEIGYAEFLGTPEGKHSRGFFLYLNISVSQSGIHLEITEPLGLQRLPIISIPWQRIASFGPLDNEWGVSGFGVHLQGMPPELDPNHVQDFLIWFEQPKDNCLAISQKLQSYAAA